MIRALSLRNLAFPRPSMTACLLATLLFAWFGPVVPKAATAQNAKHGTVYVGSNTPDNAVIAYRRDAQGNLSAPRSFSTGGVGVHPVTPDTLGVFDSDQNIISDPEGSRLFAVNSGSDTVAVFDIKNNGGLEPVAGSPFPSGGRNPVSVGLSGDILVVVNKDYDLGRPGFNPNKRKPNYTSFQVSPRGQLTQISTLSLPPGNPTTGPGATVPTQALISTNGRIGFDATFFGLSVNSYLISPTGALTLADSQGLPTSESPTPGNPFQLPVPLGLQVHPNTNVLYVGFVLDRKVGVYTYNETTGKLNFVRAVAGVGNSLSGPCWIVTNKTGTRLYVTGNFDNTIVVFDISNPKKPVQLQAVTLFQGMGNNNPVFVGNANPFQIALDPGDQFLHVVTQLGAPGEGPIANSLQVLQVDGNGLLTLVDGVILETGTSRPQGVVAR